ncbi:MAG: hypothetical protein IMZ53_12915 [Thermoplasmata archaeon]|nr:hypothetical protein [Thermoplasmata archaeon]
MKPIPNFDGYFADEKGNIYSAKRNRYPIQLHPLKDKDGYFRVNLCKNNIIYARMVHCLILETFVGNRPKGHYGCHGIYGKLNNSINNIYWGTPKQNMADKYRDGTQQVGEKAPNHKLNEVQVRIIIRFYQMTGNNHVPFLYLAKIFNCTKENISYIIRNKTWKYLSRHN